MPDRYGEREDDDDGDGEDYPLPSWMDRGDGMSWQQFVEDEERIAQERRAGIPACLLCDQDGYMANGHVCDHVDRREVYARGRAMVCGMMGWTQSPLAANAPEKTPQKAAHGRNRPGEPNPPQKRLKGAQGRSDVSC